MEQRKELSREMRFDAPRMEIVDPQEVFAWVKAIVKEKESKSDYKAAGRLRWEIGNTITDQAPGAQEADEALVIKEGKDISGAALLAPNHFVGVFVLPDKQKKGYGKQLIEEGLRRLIARPGSQQILVEIADARSEQIIQCLPKDILDRLDIVDVRKDE